MSDSDKPSSVTYYPPSSEVLEHFARSACRELGPDYCGSEVMRGFTSFMKEIAQIHANNLNRKGDNQFDNQVE